MLIQKRWNFGLGTVFSLIAAYFIFLYSRDKGWLLLAFLSKWYLIIVGGFILLSIGIVLLVLLFSLILLLIAALRLRQFKKTYKKQKKEYIDADFKVKE